SIGVPGTTDPSFAGGTWSVPTGSSGPPNDAEKVAALLCSNLAQGGYSTANKPVLIHCIAFGSLFESAASSCTNAQSTALQLMHNLEVMGSVQVSGVANNYYSNSIAPYKQITGNYTTRLANLKIALQTIMQDGVQVTLIQ